MVQCANKSSRVKKQVPSALVAGYGHVKMMNDITLDNKAEIEEERFLRPNWKRSRFFEMKSVSQSNEAAGLLEDIEL